MILRSRAPRILLAGLCLLAAFSDSPRRAARLSAAPTEIVAPEEAESGLRRSREIWEDLRHRTPPGVSWREVEMENRHRNLAARVALLQEGRAATPPGHWRERGSFNQTGRTHVTVVGTNGTTLFIGTERGGVFSGTPGVRHWVPRSDSLGIGVESFVIVPGRPEVWVASSYLGPIYASKNKGLTWAPASGGPGVTDHVVRILRDPGRPRTVYAIATWGPTYKLYRSEDGGIRFTVTSSGPSGMFSDIWIDRVHGGPLYLAARRELKKSTNRGSTFHQVGRLPGPVEEIILAGSEAGAPTFYAAIRRPGAEYFEWELFFSEDGGRTWRAGSRLPDFWSTLTASITNPKLVFVGGVNAYRSTDAGRTLQGINQDSYFNDPDKALHPDLPGIDCVFYRGKEVVFFNTDGGTFLSEDNGLTVRNITRYGLGNSQYYDILTSVNDSDLIAAGAQDQGYQVSRPGSGNVLSFDQLMVGDYGSLTSSDGTHSLLYFAYPGFGALQRTEDIDEFEFFNFPVPWGERLHPWIPPLVADPDDPNVVYWADRRIWRIERKGVNTFESEEMPHDFHLGPDWEVDYVTAFAISPADRNRWYAGTWTGRLWTSRNGGRTWTQGPRFFYFGATEFLPSPTDPNVCYVAGTGYHDGNSVYRTTDGGKTWKPWSQGLPRTLAEALAFDDPVRQELYAATQAGPFRYDKASKTWLSILGTEAPLTTYTDVESLPAEGIVRFATYGRGIWDYDPTP